MPTNQWRTGGGDPSYSVSPTIVEAYLVRCSMDKGRGTGDNQFHPPKSQIRVSPRWRRILGMLNLKKITLLRYLFSCWYRRALHWLEQDLFLELLGDFSKSEFWAFTLKYQLKHQTFGRNSYLEWCQLGWTGGFRIPDPLEIEDVRWHLETACRRLLFGQRAFKGLVSNRFFLRRLGYLVVPFRRESLGIRIKRRRKRGHTDHGSLPQHTSTREADREGGEQDLRSRLSSSLVTWLNSLLPP
jgi:hypothetical protein